MNTSNSKYSITPLGILTFDLSESLDERIRAGRYDLVGERTRKILNLFPAEGSDPTSLEMSLLHLEDEETPTSQLLSVMNALNEAHGWRGSGLGGILALGAQQPNLQRKSLIVGLGASVEFDQDTYAPGLGPVGDGRQLVLEQNPFWPKHVWYAEINSFLLVRDVPASS